MHSFATTITTTYTNTTHTRTLTCVFEEQLEQPAITAAAFVPNYNVMQLVHGQRNQLQTHLRALQIAAQQLHLQRRRSGAAVQRCSVEEEAKGKEPCKNKVSRTNGENNNGRRSGEED